MGAEQPPEIRRSIEMRYATQQMNETGGYTVQVFSCLNNYRLAVHRVPAAQLADRLSEICEKHRVDPEEIYSI